MAQLWLTWFAQPTELTTSNMLCVTSCHSLPTLSQIRHRDSISFGTSTYPDLNLKAQAQAKRGNPGVTTIVEGYTPVPRDWNKFLANSRNKVQLFRFLSKAVIEASSQFTDVVVCSTYDDHVLVNTSDSQSVADFDTTMPCNHQEADSRIFLTPHNKVIRNLSSAQSTVMLSSLLLDILAAWV